VRGKAIIIGAMGVVAAATLTANAQNAASRPTAGSLATLVAATKHVATERDEIALAVRATTSPAAATKPAAKPEEKSEAETKDVERKITITAECQAAITHLKDLHKADVAEDAQERSSAQAELAAALVADRAEDAAEAEKWKTASLAARTACVPQVPTACKTALTNLQTELQTLHTEGIGDFRSRPPADWMTDFGGVKTAFSAVQTACPERD